MIRHTLGIRPDVAAERLPAAGKRVRGGRSARRSWPSRNDALAEVDRDPARIEEHAFAIFDDAAAAAEQFDLFGERLGDRHRPDIIPERRVGPLGRVIVEDQEVADPVIFQIDQAVEFVAVEGGNLASRETVRQGPVIAAWMR